MMQSDRRACIMLLMLGFLALLLLSSGPKIRVIVIPSSSPAFDAWLDIPADEDVLVLYPRIPHVHAISGSYEIRNVGADNKLVLFSSDLSSHDLSDAHHSINETMKAVFKDLFPVGTFVLAYEDGDLPDAITPQSYLQHLKVSEEWLKKFVEKEREVLDEYQQDAIASAQEAYPSALSLGESSRSALATPAEKDFDDADTYNRKIQEIRESYERQQSLQYKLSQSRAEIDQIHRNKREHAERSRELLKLMRSAMNIPHK